MEELIKVDTWEDFKQMVKKDGYLDAFTGDTRKIIEKMLNIDNLLNSVCTPLDDFSHYSLKKIEKSVALIKNEVNDRVDMLSLIQKREADILQRIFDLFEQFCSFIIK